MSWKYKYPAQYLKLVQKHPLVPINSPAHHEAALSVLSDLALKSKLTAAEQDYFDVLSMLIGAFEEKTTTKPKVTPQEMLEFLMEQNDLIQSDISRITNVHLPHISAFLSGKRSLPKHAAAKLGGYFKLDPAVFLPDVTAEYPVEHGLAQTRYVSERRSSTRTKPARRRGSWGTD